MQFNDNQPIWLQIYDHACRAIVSGRWPERERIPSIRELAVTLHNPTKFIGCNHCNTSLYKRNFWGY